MDNPHIPVIADDNGFAEHKLAWFTEDDAGRRTLHTHAHPSRGAIGAKAMGMDGASDNLYRINDVSWTVGRHVPDPENTRTSDYGHSDLNAVLIQHALIDAGFAGQTVNLGTGLPYDRFYGPDGINREYIDKVRKSIASPVERIGGGGGCQIKGHRVFPESTAAWLDFAISDEGETRSENHSGVAVVDIGGNTTDVTVVLPDNKIDKDRSGTREAGVLHVRDRLHALLCREFGLESIDMARLDAAIRSGKMRLGSGEEDVASMITLASKEVGEKVLRFVEQKLGNTKLYDAVLFVGGGAEVLRNVLVEMPGAQIPHAPEFANARGMLKQMTFVDPFTA